LLPALTIEPLWRVISNDGRTIQRAAEVWSRKKAEETSHPVVRIPAAPPLDGESQHAAKLFAFGTSLRFLQTAE